MHVLADVHFFAAGIVEHQCIVGIFNKLQGGRVQLLLENGSDRSIVIPALGGNSLQDIFVGIEGVKEMHVHLQSPGAITELKYTRTVGEVELDDAQTLPGPSFAIGDEVRFVYEVSNPGEVSLFPVLVKDDNTTPTDVGDDFEPIFVGGDKDGDSRLDPGEVWRFAFSIIATMAGEFTSLATASAVPIDEKSNPVGDVVIDEDLARYTVTDLDNDEDEDDDEDDDDRRWPQKEQCW